MATQEYLLRYIEAHKKWRDLPDRLKLAINEDDWAKKVRQHCIHRGLGWTNSPAADVIPEHEYYESLLSHYRSNKRIFPYHLAEYICRVLRVTPFRYYRDILADAMRDDLPYDAIPNFTAADAVRILGVGRNEYISTMVQAKSKKLLWRVNRGIVKDFLPSEPLAMDPDPWWTVNLVNLTETEHKSLTRAELEICQSAARRRGVRYDSVNPGLVNYLYRRGLIWFDVPISPDDHLSIPPLEGFVSNKTAAPAGSDEVDPLETLMYQIFVAASDRGTVSQLSSILNVPVTTLGVAISVACRLKFCRKLDPTTMAVDGGMGGLESSLQNTPSASMGSNNPSFSASADSPHAITGMSNLDFDSVLMQDKDNPKYGNERERSSSLASFPASPSPSPSTSSGTAGPQHHHLQQQYVAATTGGGVALVVDSQVTGFLMMGALTPAVKKHSVTLFEGGRVYGSQVINELIDELKASVELAASFEGEMAALAGTAAALAVILECVRCEAGGRPIELFRKESIESLSPSATYRILSHSYDVVLPVAGLPYPPLPLSPHYASDKDFHQNNPTNYGPPIPPAVTPWLNLALFKAIGQAPPHSLVLPAGTRLVRLPLQLSHASGALVWPWNAASVRVKPEEPLNINGTALLFALNQILSKTAVLVHPIDASAKIVSVPLPLPGPSLNNDTLIDGQQTTHTITTGYYYESKSTKNQHNGGGGENDCTVVEMSSMKLPLEYLTALQSLGLDTAVGTLRLIYLENDNKSNNEGARNGTADDSDVPTSRFIPLSLSLGIPLQPLELCRRVCLHAQRQRFLTPDACRAQDKGHQTLVHCLHSIIKEHGEWGGPIQSSTSSAALDDSFTNTKSLHGFGLYLPENSIPLPMSAACINSQGLITPVVGGNHGEQSAHAGLWGGQGYAVDITMDASSEVGLLMDSIQGLRLG